MRALLRKDCEFKWTTATQESFDRVKQAIVESPALSLFNPNHRTILSCDASEYGVGAVLTQLDDTGTERTIAFASRSLSDAERKYSKRKHCHVFGLQRNGVRGYGEEDSCYALIIKPLQRS